MEDFLTDTIPVSMKCRRQLSYKTLNMTSIKTLVIIIMLCEG